MIANAFFHLLHEEDSGQTWNITAVIEESLRMEPAAAVVDRYATDNIRLGEARIGRGDLVRVSLAGANRDPAIFPQPDHFDPKRPNLRSHVAFAQGPHVCLGLHLARLETGLALTHALQYLPKVRPKPLDLSMGM